MERVLNQCATRDLKAALRLETEVMIAGLLEPETTKRLKDFWDSGLCPGVIGSARFFPYTVIAPLAAGLGGSLPSQRVMS